MHFFRSRVVIVSVLLVQNYIPIMSGVLIYRVRSKQLREYICIYDRTKIRNLLSYGNPSLPFIIRRLLSSFYFIFSPYMHSFNHYTSAHVK